MTSRRTPKLKTTRIQLADLHPHPDNPRRGDVAAIKASLEAHGQYRPLLVQAGTLRVLAGWHTSRALVELGEADADVILLDVGDDEARRILLADNRTGDLAGYDEAQLAELLTDLGDLAGTGFTEADLDDLIAELQEAGATPTRNKIGVDARFVNGATTADEADLNERLDVYRQKAVRSLVFDYPLPVFGWLTDTMTALRSQHSVESNAALIVKLVEDASGTFAPQAQQ